VGLGEMPYDKASCKVANTTLEYNRKRKILNRAEALRHRVFGKICCDLLCECPIEPGLEGRPETFDALSGIRKCPYFHYLRPRYSRHFPFAMCFIHNCEHPKVLIAMLGLSERARKKISGVHTNESGFSCIEVVKPGRESP